MARQTNSKDYDPQRGYDQERDVGRSRSRNVYPRSGDIDPGFGEGRDYAGRDYVGSDYYSDDRELPDYAGTPRERDIQPTYAEPLRRTDRQRAGGGYARGYDRDFGGTRGAGRNREDWERDPGGRGDYAPLRGIYAGRQDHDARYGHHYGGSGQGTQYGWGYEGARGGGWRQQGPHTGRGPEGYRRSAERILEDAHERLTRHGGVDASRIAVKVEGDEITLEGTVDSRRAKRMAEDALENISGVRDIHNRLRVEG